MCHHWEHTSIYRPLPYPLISLKCLSKNKVRLLFTIVRDPIINSNDLDTIPVNFLARDFTGLNRYDSPLHGRFS